MNYLLHCHRAPGHIVPIPEGLTELMADISREVLRCQPTDVLTFIANYLDGMLLTRENTIVAEKTVDDIMEQAVDVATFYETTSMDKNRAKYVIEKFRKNSKEQENGFNGEEVDQKVLMGKLIHDCRLKKDEAKKVAAIMRDAYQKQGSEDYQPELGPNIAWDPRVQKTLEIYAKAQPTQAEMNRAAICLQSAYRGYCVRKCTKKKLINAATLIQSAFRGHKARKSVTHETKMTETEAAVIIQSVFRAYDARRELEETINVTDYSTTTLNESTQARSSTRWEDLATAVHNKLSKNSSTTDAATTIQSIYRGNKTRYAISRYSWFPVTQERPIQVIPPPKKKKSKTSVKKSASKEPKLEDLMVIKSIQLTPRTSSVSLKRSQLSVASSNKSISHDC